MTDRPSIVRVQNIWADDLFKWCWTSMLDFYGYGCSTLVCDNHLEVAEWFEEWLKKSYPLGWEWLPDKEIDSTHNHIVFNKNRESLVFTSNIPANSYYGNYIYIVYGDCQFCHNRDRYIKAIPEVVEVTYI